LLLQTYSLINNYESNKDVENLKLANQSIKEAKLIIQKLNNEKSDLMEIEGDNVKEMDLDIYICEFKIMFLLSYSKEEVLSLIKEIKTEKLTTKLLEIITYFSLKDLKSYQEIAIYSLNESNKILLNSNTDYYSTLLYNFKNLIHICNRNESYQFFKNLLEIFQNFGLNIKKFPIGDIEWFVIESWNNGVYNFK
jgi:hypothetical protein